LKRKVRLEWFDRLPQKTGGTKMVNRINRNVGREIDTHAQSDASRGYIANARSSRNNRDNPIIDDVIAHLANAHENRRARQVNEWERMFRQNVQRAA
jgi:hypothetical protein